MGALRCQPGTSEAGESSLLHNGQMSLKAVISRIRRSKSINSRGKPSAEETSGLGLGPCSAPPPALGRTHWPSHQPHPEQECLKVLAVSPLLKNAVQGLDVPGATLGIPPGDKTCRRRKAELHWEAAPPHVCRWAHLHTLTDVHSQQQPTSLCSVPS